MKINVIQREFEENGFRQRSYKISDCKWCCEGIKKLPNIDLYYEVAENTNNPIDEYGVAMDMGIMMLKEETTYDPWEPGLDYTNEYFYKLNYCPVCGEKIDIEIIDSIDVSKELNELNEQRNIICKKRRRTDSIKKKAEYQKEESRLDKLISSYYQTDSLFAGFMKDE